MKIKHFIPFFAMALMGCAGSLEQSIGIKMENMDTSVAPGTDFYQYACGGWIKNNPLKPEYPRFGSFDEVAETNREQIKSLIEDLAAEKHENGSVGQKIGDLYALLMDSVRLNKDGYAPIKNDIERIKAIKKMNRAALDAACADAGIVVEDGDTIPTLQKKLIEKLQEG